MDTTDEVRKGAATCVSGANSQSCGNGRLKQAAAVRLPRIRIEFRQCERSGADTSRRSDTVEGAMNPIRIVMGSEIFQLPREVDRIPEEHVVKIFAPNGSDHSFNERMRNWGV
jgi:hypothetical protein